MSTKIALIRESNPYRNEAPEDKTLMLSHALPFFQPGDGRLFHRVKSGRIYRRRGEYSHTSITYWCGNNGSMSRPDARRTGQLFAELPERAILCATCEGRAIGAGLDGLREINGRRVLYRPRV